ncbi:hypothetical protein EYZ11_006364 [Aspergillus tanneri]|uniref:BZIP domain-containing protein n=1 Tax=Aspergillus tanneri TaxID=1220188 RepID=A0A4S3JFL6_9EURO|nr:hypothetical protein EYZ11_006364 [Aspergillus tanneri]
MDSPLPTPTSDLNSLLSASSYPVPESSVFRTQRTADPYADVPLYGGLQLEGATRPDLHRESPDKQPISPPHTTSPDHTDVSPKKPKRQSRAPAPSTRKRGRPRKDMEGPTGEDPEERRRMQIRLAQRAYRSRKEANISSLKDRISTLESAVEKMSATVISFSDEIVNSGVLASHADLTGHLRKTVQTCLDLAREAASEGDQDIFDLSSESSKSRSSVTAEPNHVSLPVELNSSPTSMLGLPELTNAQGLPQVSSGSFSPSEPFSMSPMELSVFMERLHISCLSQGFLFLANPKIPTDRLQRPFRFLFTVMDRAQITSFFEAALHARVSRQRLKDWREVPFFNLGGAGSHYPRKSPQNPSLDWYPPRYYRFETIHDPLALVPPEVKGELDGEWFDIQDLEGYLREMDVRLYISPPSSNPPKSSRMSVNVARFIPALINKALCLGRTPGFRRHDVDKALRSAMWA